MKYTLMFVFFLITSPIADAAEFDTIAINLKSAVDPESLSVQSELVVLYR